MEGVGKANELLDRGWEELVCCQRGGASVRECAPSRYAEYGLEPFAGVTAGVALLGGTVKFCLWFGEGVPVPI